MVIKVIAKLEVKGIVINNCKCTAPNHGDAEKAVREILLIYFTLKQIKISALEASGKRLKKSDHTTVIFENA